MSEAAPVIRLDNEWIIEKLKKPIMHQVLFTAADMINLLRPPGQVQFTKMEVPDVRLQNPL